MPLEAVPWQEYDGRKTNTSRLPKIDKTPVNWQSLAYMPPPDFGIPSPTAWKDWVLSAPFGNRNCSCSPRATSHALQPWTAPLWAAAMVEQTVTAHPLALLFMDLTGDRIVLDLGRPMGITQTRFGAEAFGLAATLSCWALLRRAGSLLDGAYISIWCDNKSLVNLCNRFFNMNQPRVDQNGNETDILACIISAGIECNRSFQVCWVKRHQDCGDSSLLNQSQDECISRCASHHSSFQRNACASSYPPFSG